MGPGSCFSILTPALCRAERERAGPRYGRLVTVGGAGERGRLEFWLRLGGADRLVLSWEPGDCGLVLAVPHAGTLGAEQVEWAGCPVGQQIQAAPPVLGFADVHTSHKPRSAGPIMSRPGRVGGAGEAWCEAVGAGRRHRRDCLGRGGAAGQRWAQAAHRVLPHPSQVTFAE